MQKRMQFSLLTFYQCKYPSSPVGGALSALRPEFSTKI